MDADPGQIAAPSLDFMLAVPVDFSDVPEQAAAVSVDVHAMIVRPEFAGTERVKVRHSFILIEMDF